MPSPSPLAWRAFAGRYVIALVLAVVFTATGVAAVNREIDSQVASIKHVKVAVATPPPEGANYLLIGSDTRAGDITANPIDRAAFCDPNDPSSCDETNSDTMMVAHIEPGAQSALVVSFPRDLRVEIPNSGGQTAKINSFYGSGGPDAVIEMLKWNFDLDIHHYVEVDFNTFREVVNAIGTVNVYFDHPTRDEFTGLGVPQPVPQGCQALDGDQALEYVRSRHTEQLIDGEWQEIGTDAPDIHRIERQQDFIRKLLGVAISRSLGNPFIALSIANDALDYMKVDQGIGRDQVNQLINAFRSVDVNDPNSVRFETIPWAVDPNPSPALGSTLVLAPGAQDMLDQLRAFGSNTPPPSSVAPAQVKVQVIDGFRKADAETRAPAVADQLVKSGFVAEAKKDPNAKTFLSEVIYGPTELAGAKLLASYVPDSSLILDPKLGDHVQLVLGVTFDHILVPAVTTSPVATEAPTTTLAPGEPSTTTSTTLPVDPGRAACG
jgi:LCP family protein required for cell wall assembly